MRRAALALGILWLGPLALVSACDDSGEVTPEADVAPDVVDTEEDAADDVATDEGGTPDTSTPDTSTPDTSTPDVTPETVEDTSTTDAPEDTAGPSGALCPQVAPCWLAACAGKEGAELTTCLADAAASCPAVVSEEEGVATEAWVACMNAAACEAAPSKKHYACMRASCLAETVTCHAFGVTHGTGGCGKINGCVELCRDFAGDLDPACTRDCLAAAELDSVSSYYAWQLCVRSECFESATPEVCGQQVSTSELCVGAYDECLGDL